MYTHVDSGCVLVDSHLLQWWWGGVQSPCAWVPQCWSHWSQWYSGRLVAHYALQWSHVWGNKPSGDQTTKLIWTIYTEPSNVYVYYHRYVCNNRYICSWWANKVWVIVHVNEVSDPTTPSCIAKPSWNLRSGRTIVMSTTVGHDTTVIFTRFW